jgi:hypothetical protein
VLLIDYKPRFYWWDCLEMLRKAILTGILMFFKKGSLTQLVMAMLTSLGFLSAAAWFEPFAAPTANAFKLGTEIALLMTLMLIVLLKIDLSKEDIPGGGDTVGAALLLSTWPRRRCLLSSRCSRTGWMRATRSRLGMVTRTARRRARRANTRWSSMRIQWRRMRTKAN